MLKVKVGNTTPFRSHRESKVFVELLGYLEVFGRDEGLDFCDAKIHRNFPLRGLIQTLCRTDQWFLEPLFAPILGGSPFFR